MKVLGCSDSQQSVGTLVIAGFPSLPSMPSPAEPSLGLQHHSPRVKSNDKWLSLDPHREERLLCFPSEFSVSLGKSAACDLRLHKLAVLISYLGNLNLEGRTRSLMGMHMPRGEEASSPKPHIHPIASTLLPRQVKVFTAGVPETEKSVCGICQRELRNPGPEIAEANSSAPLSAHWTVRQSCDSRWISELYKLIIFHHDTGLNRILQSQWFYEASSFLSFIQHKSSF